MKKLVLFGDSLLAQAGKNRILMLEQKLNGKYDVYNCAAGGWDTRDLLKKSAYISTLKPDVILLSVGTNDASPWKLIEAAEFSHNLRELLKIFKGTRIIYFLPMPVDEKRHSLDKQRRNELQKRYHDDALKVCTEQTIEFIKSWQIFLPKLQNGEEYLIEDGVHLNDHAYDVIFNEVAGFLNET